MIRLSLRDINRKDFYAQRPEQCLDCFLGFGFLFAEDDEHACADTRDANGSDFRAKQIFWMFSREKLLLGT